MNFSGAASAVLGREAMRDLDARTIAAGTPSLELMERAGVALADALLDEAFHGVALPAEPRLLVLAGRGNNGGDGFVVARLLTEQGWDCRVLLLDGSPRPDGDAATNLKRWRESGGVVLEGEAAAVALAEADEDIALDAVFGTGLDRPLAGPHFSLIEKINFSGLPLVSADIPSGLCCDSGVPLGVAVRARATLSLGAAKPGLFRSAGPSYCGRVRVAEIGLLEPAAGARLADVLGEYTLAGAWPRLDTQSHKGTRGHVLVLAGSRGKTGAAVLAARGALRAGAGLVTVAGVAEVQSAIAHALPEAMTRVLGSDSNGELAVGAGASLHDLLETVDVVVAGPGLGVGAGSEEAVSTVLGFAGPLLLDADALNVVAGWEGSQRLVAFGRRSATGAPPAVLTPHPGEMSRLVGAPTSQIQQLRDTMASNLAKTLGAIVLLKGAATVVCDGEKTAFNLSGNPGMACAGMGDVLSGIGGALLARMPDAMQAACLAAYVHGAAGDRLFEFAGVGFLASELADALPAELSACLPR